MQNTTQDSEQEQNQSNQTGANQSSVPAQPGQQPQPGQTQPNVQQTNQPVQPTQPSTTAPQQVNQNQQQSVPQQSPSPESTPQVTPSTQAQVPQQASQPNAIPAQQGTGEEDEAGLGAQTPKPIEVDFPPKPQTAEEQPQAPAAQAQVTPTAAKGKKILIVEDEIPLRKALTRKLTQEGYLVTEAENGKDGLNKASAEKPDLIITDIVMPDMDGLNMIKNIRESDWGKDAHIILITNLNNSDDVATALQYNVIDYLVKSDMKLKDIIDKVNEKLSIG
ncbi:response regulator [Candidatus Dojkabacteria bacterium]|nr:response regulator [Candidatus Dojkabacteria bacterium]